MNQDSRRSSTLALSKALSDCLAQSPTGSPYIELRSALSSQGQLARFSSDTLGVKGCSLNTLKASADVHVQGGFARIDELRKQILQATATEAGSRPERAQRTKKERLQHRVADAESNLQLVREDLMFALWLLRLSMRHGRKYAQQSGIEAVVEACRRQQRELLTMLKSRTRLNIDSNTDGEP